MDSDKNLVKKFFRKIRKSKTTKMENLHEAIKNHVDPKIARFKMKKYPDIDYIDEYFKTPLYYACEKDEIEWACMLLYYGANPCILATEKKLLPIFTTKCLILQEILLPYYITQESKISLVTLGAGLQASADIFSKFLENVSGVNVDIDDVDLFIKKQVTNAQVINLKLFVEKFTQVAWELCTHYGLLDRLITLLHRPCLFKGELRQIANIFEILLRSEDIYKLRFYKPDLDFPENFAEFFTDRCDNSRQSNEISTIAYYVSEFFNDRCRNLKLSSEKSIIAYYVAKFSFCNILNQDQITNNVLLMISHGLEVTEYDLATIFTIYGQCELFEILLHIDVIDRSRKYQPLFDVALPPCCYYCLRSRSAQMVPFRFFLYYFPRLCIDNIRPFECDPDVLDFYSGSEFRQICLSKDNIQKIKNLPDVPKLVELSRDVVRRFLVTKYRIFTSKQLMFVLGCLPIDRMTRRIIALLEKLY